MSPSLMFLNLDFCFHSIDRNLSIVEIVEKRKNLMTYYFNQVINLKVPVVKHTIFQEYLRQKQYLETDIKIAQLIGV